MKPRHRNCGTESASPMLLRMLERSASITPGTTAISCAAISAVRAASLLPTRDGAAFAVRTDLATGMFGAHGWGEKLVSRA